MRRVREATSDPSDEGFLREMLVEAVAWRPGAVRPAVADVLENPRLALYVEGWGRPGDAGVIAEEAGRPVGAAWCRFFTVERHGYGFIEPAVPELTVAICRETRGCGVGKTLLGALVAQVRKDHAAALSLSVEKDNSALRLYERIGFVRVGCVDNAWTMRLDT